MTCLTSTVRDVAKRSVLCWLATSDAEGHPNVSPKEIFCISDNDQLLIANIASPKSVANIALQPAVCVSMVDVFEQKGVKLGGTARLLPNSDVSFEDVARPLLDLAGPDFPIRHAIIIDVHTAKPIIAPSHTLRRDLSDEDRRQSAYEAYGVTPSKPLS